MEIENVIEEQQNNPLHGVKLTDMLDYLVEHVGWKRMHEEINILCFGNNPSIQSSLVFLRRTAWARERVERLYLRQKRKVKAD